MTKQCYIWLKQKQSLEITDELGGLGRRQGATSAKDKRSTACRCSCQYVGNVTTAKHFIVCICGYGVTAVLLYKSVVCLPPLFVLQVWIVSWYLLLSVPLSVQLTTYDYKTLRLPVSLFAAILYRHVAQTAHMVPQHKACYAASQPRGIHEAKERWLAQRSSFQDRTQS